jgi:putative DNA primase/helicase
MRCGKSTLLRSVGRLVPRPLPTANITPAALFRVIEACKPCLLLDEADSFAHENEELRGIVNSSHCCLDAFVVRAVPAGDDYEARRFSTWAPIAIASIGKVASTVADRAVTIAMERKAPGQAIARMHGGRDDGFGVLASKAARWTADHLEALRQADPDVPGALNDRQADNWRGLLSIADLIGAGWPTRARAAALALSAADEDAESIGVMLLADLKVIFDSAGAESIWTEDLPRHLHEMSERPWGEYGRQRRPITARQLAALLKPFGIVSRQIRRGETNKHGFERAQFAEPWSRYATPLQATDSASFGDSISATADQAVADRNPPKARESASCSGVADSERLPGQEVACDHCGEPVEPGTPGTTAVSSGEYLHNRCLDAWIRP